MSFSINEDTQYIKSVKTAENVFGRDFNSKQMRQNRNLNIEHELYYHPSRRNHFFGQDLLTPSQLPQTVGVPKLYDNRNDRLIAEFSNNCKIMDSPDKVYNRYRGSEPNFLMTMNTMNTSKDPRFLQDPDNNYVFTQNYKKSR